MHKGSRASRDLLIFTGIARNGWGRGIRTPDPGTRTQCLTAWPFPNNRGYYILAIPLSQLTI
jgi:hypothetical protein